MRGLFTCGFVRFVRFYLLSVLGYPAVDQYVAPRIGSLEHSSYCHLCCCGLSAPSWAGSDQALIWTCIEALLFFNSHKQIPSCPFAPLFLFFNMNQVLCVVYWGEHTQTKSLFPVLFDIAFPHTHIYIYINPPTDDEKGTGFKKIESC